MSRLKTIDLCVPPSLASDWQSKGLHIPYEIFDIFTKLFCPQIRARYGRITFNLGNEFRISGGVETCEIEAPFEWEKYQRMSELDRKQTILDLLVGAMLSYSGDLCIDKERVRNVATRIRGDEFCWIGPIGTPKSARSSSGSKASLTMEFRDIVTVFLNVTQEAGLTMTKAIYSREVTENYWFESLRGMFHSLRWDSDTNILIFQDNGRDYWSFDTATSKLTFHYPKAEMGDAQGEYALGMIYLAGRMVPQDQKLAIQWIQRAAEKGYKHAIRMLERLTAPKNGVQD